MAVTKGSPWKNLVSNYILKYREEGKIAELDKKWLAKLCTEESNVSHNELSLVYFGGLMIALAIFVGVSSIILIFEHLYVRSRLKPLISLFRKFTAWNQVRKAKKLCQLPPQKKPASNKISEFSSVTSIDP